MKTVVRMTLLAAALALAGAAGSSWVPARAATTDQAVQIVNLSSQSFAADWLTTSAVTSSMEYGTSCANATNNVPEESGDGYAHLADLADTASGLDPSTRYYFKLVNDGVVDDNGGACYTVTTFSRQDLPPVPVTVEGKLDVPGCTAPAPGSLVFLTITHAGVTSTPLATLSTSDTGGWSIPAGDVTDSSGNFLDPQSGDAMKIFAASDPGLKATDSTTYQPGTGGSPQVLPTLCTSPTPVTVTASSLTITYGQADVTPTYVTPSSSLCQSGAPPNPYCKPRVVDPIVTCGYSISGVSPSIAATGLTTARAGTGAGTYTTTCWGAYDPSYTFSYVSGTLTVDQASLTVKANSRMIARGARVPHLTWRANFVNHDTASSLKRRPTCRAKVKTNTAGKVISPPGVYAIRCRGAKSPNYRIRYAAARLTVTRRRRLR